MASTDIKIVVSAVDQASSTLKGVGANLTGASKNFTAFGVAAGIAATATVVAVAKITSSAYDLALTGAKFNSAKDAFATMTKDMGVNVDSLLASMSKASGGTINNMTLLENSVRASTLIGKGAFSDFSGQMTEIASLSKRAARATGQDVSYVFDSIITGVGRNSQMLLDNAGIMIDTVEVKKAYAASLGKEASQLTQTEEKAATLNAVIASLKKSYGDVALSSGGLTGSSQQLGVAIDNLKLKIGQSLETAFIPLIKYLTDLVVTYGPMVEAFITRLVALWTSMSPQMQMIVLVFAGIVAGLALLTIAIGLILPALTMLWGVFVAGAAVVTSIIALVLSPLVLTIGAIIAVVVALYMAWQNNFLGIQTIVTTVFNIIVGIFYWFGVVILAAINLALMAISAVFGTKFASIQQIVSTFVNAAIGLFNWLRTTGLSVISTFIQGIANFFKTLGSVIVSAIGDLWGQIKGPFEAAYNKIMEWVDKVKSALKKIAFNTKGSPTINQEIEKGLQDASGIFRKYSNISAPVVSGLPQTGNITQPTGGGTSIGGSNVTLNVQIGMYAGSVNEKRSIAEELYKTLVTIASSKNKTVAEYLGA